MRTILENVYQHEYLEMPLERGLTGVSGGNGSGKTNAWFHAQIYAMTGVAPTREGSADMLTFGATEGRTKFEFPFEGKQCELVRELGRSRGGVKLTMVDAAGEVKRLTAASEVEAVMERFLGLPMRMFRELAQVRQQKFAEVVLDRQARLDFFQRACGVQEAKTGRSVIVAAMGALPELADETPETLALATALERAEAEFSRLEGRVASFSAAKAKTEAKLAEASGLAAMETLESIARRRLDIEARRADVESKLGKRPELPKAPPEPTEVDRLALAAETELADVERKAQAAVKTLDTSRQRVDIARTRLDATKAKLAEREAEMASLDANDPSPWMEDALEAYEAARRCPVCLVDEPAPGRSSELLEAYRAGAAMVAKRQRARLSGECTELSRSISADEAFLAKAETVLERDELDEAAAAKALDVCRVRVDGGDASITRAFASWTAAFRTAEAAAARWDVQSRLQEGKLAELAADLARLPETGPTDAEAAVALGMAEKARAELDAGEAAGRDLAASRAGLEAARKALDKALERQRRRDARAEVRATMKSAAEKLSPTGFPRQVVAGVIDLHNRWLAHYMERFRLDYAARLTEDLEFEFDKGHGWKPARHMSGGEVHLLAINSRVATLRAMSPALPLLILDEPTDSLDDERRASLRDLFSEMDLVFRDSACIQVITHDEDLLSALPRRISMG